MNYLFTPLFKFFVAIVIVMCSMVFCFQLFNSFASGFLGLIFNTLKFCLVIAIAGLWIQSHFMMAFLSSLFWLILTSISTLATMAYLSASFIHESVATFIELAVMFEFLPYVLIGFGTKENIA